MNSLRSAVLMASDVGRLTVLAADLWFSRWNLRARRPGSGDAV